MAGLALVADGRLAVAQPQLVSYDTRAVGTCRPERFGPDEWSIGPLADTDGRAVIGLAHGLEVWDTTAGRRVIEIPYPNQWRVKFTVSADGRFATVCGDETAGVCDLCTGTVRRIPLSDRFADGSYHSHRQVIFEPVRDRLYAAAFDLLEVYDGMTGWVWGRKPLDAVTKYLAASADGRRLIVATYPGVLHILDPDTLATRAAFDWHLGRPTAFALSPDGSFAATTGVEGVVKLWPLDRLLPAESA